MQTRNVATSVSETPTTIQMMAFKLSSELMLRTEFDVIASEIKSVLIKWKISPEAGI